jgi:hypothetical protein
VDIEKMKAEGVLKVWEHPVTGARRMYIQIGRLDCLELDYYKSGNISNAFLFGECISSSIARRLVDTALWFDETGEWHYNTRETDIIERIKTYITDRYAC